MEEVLDLYEEPYDPKRPMIYHTVAIPKLRSLYPSEKV
jgi:hypothetical protein